MMDRPIEHAGTSLAVFGLGMLALQFAALWLGVRLGRRHARGAAAARLADPAEGAGLVVGAMLGLLAFTLGLTISIATNRFEERRRTAIDEANAIGTAWLRAQAIGHPRTDEIARQLEDYTRTRIAWLSAAPGSAELVAARRGTLEAHGRIWGHAAALVRDRPDAMTASLVASLNETFDLAATQRWAFRGQLPAELPWLLFGLTVMGVAGIGYQWGLKGHWHPMLALLLICAWSASLVLIADLANPRAGGVRVDIAPYAWTLESFRDGVTVPPLR